LSLDIPDQVRKTVIADGNESWLDELPGVVDSLAQEWSLMIGSSFAGGHAGLVVEVTLVDGTPAVLKIGVPGRDVGQEALVLRLANGGGCAKLLGEDVGRQALLLERLGAPMYDRHPRSITGPVMIGARFVFAGTRDRPLPPARAPPHLPAPAPLTSRFRRERPQWSVFRVADPATAGGMTAKGMATSQICWSAAAKSGSASGR